MPTACTASGPIVKGDAVCVIGWDTLAIPNRPIVSRATAANLGTSKTVHGIAQANPLGPVVQVLVAGEVADNSITSLTTSAGWAGVSRVVATDINNGVAANQGKLIVVDRPNGSEHVLGTCDQGGNLAIQPRASRDTSAQHVFNVCAYGATLYAD